MHTAVFQEKPGFISLFIYIFIYYCLIFYFSQRLTFICECRALNDLIFGGDKLSIQLQHFYVHGHSLLTKLFTILFPKNLVIFFFLEITALITI